MPFHAVIRHGDEQCVRLLLQCGQADRELALVAGVK